jgi:hypothetical protein
VVVQSMKWLHGWALEQAARLLRDGDLDSQDAQTLQRFTSEFCEMTRKSLLEIGHSEQAVAKLAAEASQVAGVEASDVHSSVETV